MIAGLKGTVQEKNLNEAHFYADIVDPHKGVPAEVLAAIKAL